MESETQKQNTNTKKRAPPSPKIKLQIMKRDNYSCKICGRSPATHLGIPP
jgi:hypothetical protein